MGKGYINEHLGEGKYSLTLKFNRNRAEERISRMQDRIDALDGEIPDLEDAAAQAETDLSQASEDLNAAIETGERETIETAQGVYLSARQAYVEASRAVTAAKGEKTSLEKRIQTLDKNLPEDKTLDAWCADLTTTLSGEVGTVEVPGERKHVQIRPGYEGRAAFDPERDGQITPIFSTHPAATFYNLALLPGWQRWMPQYRLGEITAINTDTDTCSLTLDSETSSAQSLSVDQDLSLSDVPIEYMNCNSGAFTVGDRVLVEFLDQDFDDPVVVGFESEPSPCDGSDIYRCPAYLQLKISSGAGPEQWYIFVGDSLVYGEGGGLLGEYYDEDGSTPDADAIELIGSIGDVRIRELPISAGCNYPVTMTVNIQQYKPAIWDFCNRHPHHPLCNDGLPRETGLFQEVSYDDWLETMEAVNTYVNENSIYEGDRNEYWDVMSFPNASGDCEDYSLTKMQLLVNEGLPAEAMDIVLCKYDGGGHAVLGVQTDRGVAYLDQSPNSPLLDYPEIEDAKFVTRTLYPYEFEALNRYAEVVGEKEIKINGEGEFNFKTQDGISCVKFYFRDLYMVALRFHGFFEYDPMPPECGGGGWHVCAESTGTAYMHFYYVLYRAVVRDGYRKDADENWEWEQIAEEFICAPEIGLVGQDSGKFKVDSTSFSIGPFSASTYPHTDEPSYLYSHRVMDLEKSLDFVDGCEPVLMLPGCRDRETYVPEKDIDPYYYVTLEEEYVDKFVIQIDRPADLDAAFKNFSQFYAV